MSFRYSTRKSSYGEWINAQIKFKGDKVGCLPILDDGTILTENKDVIAVLKNNTPENLFEGKHSVKLSQDKKSVLDFNPYNGQYPARFLKFGGKEGEAPSPKTLTGDFGDYRVFYVIYEIFEGQYKSCHPMQELIYKFQPGEDGIVEYSFKKPTIRSDQLKEFCDTVLPKFDALHWPDSGNLLPLFEKMALKANKNVGLVFKKGWIVTLVELDQPTHKSKKDDSEPPWTPDEE
jgi:hypothetical protein